MQYATKAGALLAAGALLVALPGPAAAQSGWKVDVDGYGGIAVPAGALGAATDVGGSFGGGLAFRFHPNFSVRGDVEVSLLTEVSTGGVQVFAPMDLLHFNGGIEFNFPQPQDQDNPFTWSLNLGAGATQMESSSTAFVPAFDATYFTLNGGSRIGYQLHRNVNIFVRGGVYLIVADEEETAIFSGAPVPVGAFSEAWSIPITLGVRLTFP